MDVLWMTFFPTLFCKFLMNYGKFHSNAGCVDDNYDIHKVFSLEDL